MKYDAVVVGAGPNGLSAAITLARAGLRVQLLEAHHQVGGGLSSRSLTLPGFIHDYGSAIHPLAAASPAFKQWPLHAFGLDWVYPEATVAHPLEAQYGGAVLIERDFEQMVASLGEDGPAYRRLVGPVLAHYEDLLHDILRPLLRIPAHPFTLARFGLRGLPSAALLASLFKTQRGKAVIAGMAAHTTLPLSAPGTGAMTLVMLLLAHATGWPFPRGGASALANAMQSYFEYLGGEVVTGAQIDSRAQLPQSRVVLVDSSPKVLLRLLGKEAPPAYRAALEGFRYGPGLQKFDYALSGPVPWQDPAVLRAATVHIGGTFHEIAESERNHLSPRPYVLAAQHTPFDRSRAPQGQHTFWAYAHVPAGSNADIRPAVEAQIERFAPGFRGRVLASTQTTAQQLQQFSPVFHGGDVNGGKGDLLGLVMRPVISATPYRTPVRGVYLCSSSTPPGGGVHGMAGYHAALAALKDEFGMQDIRGEL